MTLDNLDVFDGVATLNDTATVGNLLIFGNSLAQFNAPSEIDFATVLFGAELEINQQSSALDGMSIRTLAVTFGTVQVNFDAQSGPSGALDWGLRLDGDQQSLMQNLLNDGSLVFSGATGNSIGVIYDNGAWGDFTYLGFVHSSVPEPGATGLCLLILSGLTMRRNRPVVA